MVVGKAGAPRPALTRCVEASLCAERSTTKAAACWPRSKGFNGNGREMGSCPPARVVKSASKPKMLAVL